MTQKDLTQLTLVVKGAVAEAVTPLHDEIIKHRQTLYGPNNDNGLCGQMKKVKDIADDYRSDRKAVIAVGSLVALVFGSLGGIVSKLLKIGG